MGQRGLLSAVFGKETRSFLHSAAPTIATESTISTVSRYPPKTTKPTISTKSRFHGTPRKARFQRNQRNHDFTAPQRNHESNETHEKNETPGKKAFRCFRCVLRLPVALSVSFADSSPTGGAKSTPVGAGQAVVRRTSLRLCLTTRLPGLTAVRLAPPSGELARRPQGGETERGATPVSVSGTRGGSSRKSGGTAGKSCWGCRSRSRRRSGRCCRPGGPAGRRRPA